MHRAGLALDLQLPACSASGFSEGSRHEMAPAELGAFLSSLWEEGAAISNVLPPWWAHLGRNSALGLQHLHKKHRYNAVVLQDQFPFKKPELLITSE